MTDEDKVRKQREKELLERAKKQVKPVRSHSKKNNKGQMKEWLLSGDDEHDDLFDHREKW